MAIIPIRDVPGEAVEPSGNELILIDNGIAMQKATINDAVTPKASEIADQKIADLNLGTAAQANVEDFATAAQGDLADSAVQPGDLAAVATSGDYNDLANLPTLGTAAAANVEDFATAAQAVPAGGTTGQVLVKNSDADNDTGWETVAAATPVSYTPQDLTQTQRLQALQNIRNPFETVSDLLTDSAMGYVGGGADVVVSPGDIIKAQGFRYKVAASSVSDHHIETAGGVKLYVQPSITGRYNPLAFGAAMDGVTDDSDILNKVIAIGPVILPAGTIYVGQPIILPPQANIKGLGQRRSYIKSGVVNGVSTIKLAQTAIPYLHLSGFTLQGNGLTGEDGNGHAIDFIDWDGMSGTHNPQHSLVERIEITGFKGFGPRDPNASATVPACAVIQWNGLAVTYRKVSALNCSVGFWMERAQNSRIQDCIGDNCTYSAVLAISTENLVVSECDFVNCADGSTPSWPVNVYNATVTSYANYGFVLEKTKLKNSRGGHLVASRESQGDVISKNWISVDDKWGTNHHGVFAHRSPGIRIIKNTFEPRMGASPNKARNIEIYTDQTWMGVDATVEGNTFLDPATDATTEFNIKLSGNSTSRTLSSVSIVGNTFGDAFAVAHTATIEADILIENCTLRNSIIAYNRHQAVTQVTRNVGVKKAANATLINVEVGPNDFLVSPEGGTIVAEYDGLTETILTGETVWDPDSIPSGSGRSTTVTVTGAMPGDLVEASSFSASLQGLIPYAYVSSSNTVTFVLHNPSTNPIDLASGTVRVRVRRVT